MPVDPPASVRRRRAALLLALLLAAGAAFAAGLAAAREEPPRRQGLTFVHPPAADPTPGAAADGGGADALAALPAAGGGGWRLALASWYDGAGRETACGEVLAPGRLGVASRTLPCGTLVTFARGGRALTVPVIDRGPYVAGRDWDLTAAAAEALGLAGVGVVRWRLREAAP